MILLRLSLQENVQKASEKLNTMSSAFFVRLVPSEALVLKTPDLIVYLKKVSPEGVQGLSMEEGPATFKLPGNLGNVAGEDINVKVCGVDTSISTI